LDKGEKILVISGMYQGEGLPAREARKKASLFYRAWSNYTRSLRRKSHNIAENEFPVDIEKVTSKTGGK
jgi:hypothetical protein